MSRKRNKQETTNLIQSPVATVVRQPLRIELNALEQEHDFQPATFAFEELDRFVCLAKAFGAIEGDRVSVSGIYRQMTWTQSQPE